MPILKKACFAVAVSVCGIRFLFAADRMPLDGVWDFAFEGVNKLRPNCIGSSI